MTEEKKADKRSSPHTSFRLEAVRHRRGMSLMLSGIVCVSDFNDRCVSVKGHGGRVEIQGKRLELTVFENSSIEITGRVEGVCFFYGKN